MYLDVRSRTKRTPGLDQRAACAQVDDDQPVAWPHPRAHGAAGHAMLSPPIVPMTVH
jgi:hypothetical protein